MIDRLKPKEIFMKRACTEKILNNLAIIIGLIGAILVSDALLGKNSFNQEPRIEALPNTPGL